MRLFTGIDLPKSVQDQLAALIGRVRSTARLRWSPTANLHLTTKFIGEWPQPRLDELVARLRTAPAGTRVDIRIRGLGWFPNPHSPRVFWAGVEASASLAELARATEQACAALGIAVEKRPFSPHLTLARIPQPVPLEALRKAVADLESVDFGSFTAPAYHLYLSSPTATGSIYTSLADFPLPVA
jgi:2'-5' RNA ligase